MAHVIKTESISKGIANTNWPLYGVEVITFDGLLKRVEFIVEGML